MLSIKTLASGNISFTNYAPVFAPTPSLCAEYPLFPDTRQHNGKQARPEHPGRTAGLVAEPGAARIPNHTMPPHPCCVMNPKCSFHIPRAAGCWACCSHSSLPVILLPKNVTVKGTNPVASAPCLGCKLAKYVRVSTATTLCWQIKYSQG